MPRERLFFSVNLGTFAFSLSFPGDSSHFPLTSRAPGQGVQGIKAWRGWRPPFCVPPCWCPMAWFHSWKTLCQVTEGGNCEPSFLLCSSNRSCCGPETGQVVCEGGAMTCPEWSSLLGKGKEQGIPVCLMVLLHLVYRRLIPGDPARKG